jgi:hypothetical protein
VKVSKEVAEGCLQVAGYQSGVAIERVLTQQPSADAGSLLIDFSTLKMEAIRSSETLVNPGSTQRHIPKDDILQSHCCENLKSYIV